MTIVRPKEFVVDDGDPFERDLLDRKGRVEGLCGLIRDLSAAAVLAVNGPFGSGKSVFLRMCASHLRSLEVRVAEFNAWHQSHTKTPLVDLVAAVASSPRFTEEAARSLREVAVKLAWRTASAATRGIVEREDFQSAEGPSRFDDWNQTEERRKEFHERLERIVAQDGKLVVLIDELDRCPPSQALEILDVARHLFDVPGVVVVLGINEQELQHRVKTLYGEGCKAEEFLRRFIDLPVDLPHPGANLAGFMNEAFASVGLSGRLQAGSDHYSGSMLAILADKVGMSARDVLQFTHRLARVLALSPAPEQHDRRGWAVEHVTLALCALRWADTAGYRKLMAGDADAAEAAHFLVEALSAKELLAGGDPFILLMATSLVRLDPGAADQQHLEAAGFDSDIATVILNKFQQLDSEDDRFWIGHSRDRFFEFVELAA